MKYITEYLTDDHLPPGRLVQELISSIVVTNNSIREVEMYLPYIEEGSTKKEAEVRLDSLTKTSERLLSSLMSLNLSWTSNR